MKTFRFLVLLVLLTAVVIPAAGQDVSFPVELPEEVAGGQEVNITVAACIGEDQEEARADFDAQLARFTERYPNVTAERTQYCFSPETFAALVAGGNLPVVFEVPFTEPQRLIREGIAADLTDSFAAYGIEDAFNSAVLDVVSADGAVYGFPGFAYAQGIAYSIPLLEAAGFDGPPQTWAEVAEMAAALVDPGMGVAGFALNMQGGGGGWHFTNVAYGFGATELIRVNEDGTYTAVYGEGPAVEAMQFLYDLRWPDAENVLPFDMGSNPILELVGDRAAIAMNPGDGLGWVRINMPDVDLTQFGYAAVPAGPDGARYSLTGGSATMINAAATPEQQEAGVVFQIWRQLSEDEFPASRAIFHGTQAGSGAPVLPTFGGAYADAVAAFDAEFIAMPVENYALFNDAVTSGQVTLVPEPPFAQEFYVAIAEVMTTVLTDPNADVAQLMADNAAAFQAGILDAAQ